MGKRRKNWNAESGTSKRRHRDEDFSPKDMDDEIDSFHKQRDVIPLDTNDDFGESDEDMEHPVLDYKEIYNDEEDDDDDDDDGGDEDEDEDDDDDIDIAKIKKQINYMKAKTGGVEEEMHDDDEEEEEEKSIWGKKYLHGDRADFELSDEDEIEKEEAEVLRLQKEKVKNLSMEDFGLEDLNPDENDGEPTFEEILGKEKGLSKAPVDEEIEVDKGTAYEEVKKDLNSLSKEEQMDVVNIVARELVGLLSELHVAVEQLETKVNPLLSKVKREFDTKKGGMNYLELKQLLLLVYCQAIIFYLLLKSEGQPVRDHPVISRLVEIKNILDKISQLDNHLPSRIDDMLKEERRAEIILELVEEKAVLAFDSTTKTREPCSASSGKQAAAIAKRAETVEVNSSKEFESKGTKHKSQKDQAGVQSRPHLSAQSRQQFKVRAALEEMLKQKDILTSVATKSGRVQKHLLQPTNGQFETLDDFDDDAVDVDGWKAGNGKASLTHSSKISHDAFFEANKSKMDDVGKKMKHELPVLARPGIKSGDDTGHELGKDMENGDSGTESDEREGSDSENEVYKQAEQARASKLATEAEHNLRTAAVPSLPETVDGKRLISYQIEKNRGLTRARKKLTKNPRKKYKLKHEKAVSRRKGQVRGIKKPSGPYAGEASGINAGISRSMRFKN